MTIKRTTMWCAECVSDSHDYPDCPEGDSTPTPDVAAQIREQLDTWGQTPRIEPAKELTDDELADLRARFRAAHTEGVHEIRIVPPSAFDRMRGALLAVLDADPTTRQVDAIAKALGIEVPGE